ncbi:hypothetical protein Leryth_003529 [Lithospermum erythrorhizon]|nr:hypothetical protein Leryth_003529 [Lithospermum erythrorhizon]
MVRVQQLEKELPLIEKEFLRQTNYSSFFYNAGIDWHPNKHIEKSCITKRGLPRFIMDSYEETKAPPRLFLLDKFDVGGAGACLRRYTNPSFFTEEAATLGTTNPDMQREKKSRKGKRRGTHWRNGRTSEALPTPHSKLHQLLLEEKIETNASDHAHHVKLKRRLNGFPFDLKTGQSYLEKILKDRSPDHKLSKEVSVGLAGCELEAEVERHFNGSENRDMELTNKNPYLKPETKNVVSNIFKGEIDLISDGEHYDSLKGNNILEAHNSSSNRHEDVSEKKIIVDRESKAKATAVGYQPDDVTSEVDIYIDLLASDPQMDFDPNLKGMTDFHVSSDRKQVPTLALTKSLHQARFPDCQSMGSPTLSDDGISSLKKCISTSSYSDAISKVAGCTHSGAELSNAYLFNEIYEAQNTYSPQKRRDHDAGCSDVADNSTLSSDNSELTVSNGISAQRDEDATLGDHGILKVQSRGLSAQSLLEIEPSISTESEIKLEHNSPFDSDTSTSPLQGDFGYSFGIFATNQTLASVQDKHLYTHESLSRAPNLSDSSYSRRASADQDIKESDDEDLYLHPDYGVLVKNEENLSTCSPKCHILNLSADDDSNLRVDPPNLTSENSSLKEVDRDILNDPPKLTPEDPPSPVLDLLPEAARINLEEVPPLPPLPPVQWRNRNNQPIPLAHENEAHSDNETPSFSQSMTNQKIHRHAVMSKDLPLVHESTSSNSVQDGSFSSLVNYILLNELHLPSQKLSPPGNKTDRSSLGEIESITQKLPLPANLDGMPQHDGHIEQNSNTISQGTTADVTDAGDIAEAHDFARMFQQNGAWVTRSKDNFFVQCSPYAEGSASTLEGDPAPLKTENEQTKVMKPNPVGESTWPSEAEQKINDVRAMKLPRLRNPLIDDVVAHDNSKLKKVKQRIDSEIKIPDGRDSLLEQIRAKSFNLKPAVVQRPSIQGPTTNLRVAAILEKAKTIRQAFAGSEDDDDDSWSD